MNNSLVRRCNATPVKSHARILHPLLGVLFLGLGGLATTASAEETYSYWVQPAGGNATGWLTAATYSEAILGIHAKLGNASARFNLVSSTPYGESVQDNFVSTPHRYAFWNKSHYNCLAYDGPSVPANDKDEAVANIKAHTAATMAADPAWCVAFETISITGGFSADGPVTWENAGWNYKATATGTNISYSGSRNPINDIFRGGVARAQIVRSMVPKSDCPCVGNPIDPQTGAKLATETDYKAPSGLLSFARAYNSQMPSLPGGMGNKGSWQHNFERALYSGNTFFYTSAAFRFDSDVANFYASGPGLPWAATKFSGLRLLREQNSDIGSTMRLFVPADNSNELYDANGLLLAISRADDQVLLSYSTASAGTRYPANAPACAASAVSTKAGQLMCVTNRFGRQLNFEYDADGWLVKMVDPAGLAYVYQYDTASGNLLQMTTPEGYRRVYYYNEPEHTSGASLRNALTGIGVERNPGVFTRFATYRYDARGLAISTEHAGGVEKFSVSYDLANKKRSVATPSGVSSEILIEQRGPHWVRTGESRSAPGVAAGSTSSQYDVNGNLQTRTDFNGAVTQFTYDLTRNLETKRVEAFGTPEVRTTTTEWHATFRLPLRIAMPRKLVTNTYDLAGNLLASREQSTSDLNGAQGFGAALVGTPRIRSYEYNAASQIVRITGARTDVSEVTTFGYDGQGNLTSVNNPAGHPTILSNYDAHGRAGRITDANGLATDYVYTPRGVIASSTTGSESTSYTYDGADKLIQVSRSGGLTITYTYDDALRLTGIADNLGNTVTYALDPAGNRIGETTRDSGGVLARQITRVFDELNRIKQVTGGQQ